MISRKKTKSRKRYWLLFCLAAALLISVLLLCRFLLLYRPAGYAPPMIVDDRQVSPYLTHEILPRLYNGAQRQEPFDLVITQKGINDVVVRSKWPRRADGISFSAPEVFFLPGKVVLMGIAAASGIEFIVTVVIEPRLDEQGLLNLSVAKVKVGAVNITPAARVIAKRMYAQRPAETNIKAEDLPAKITASLLNSEPFEPVFSIKGILENEDKKLRLKQITIVKEGLTLRLAPASG